MPIVSLEDLPALLRPGQRLLGLDVGTRTIGVAVADPTLTIASPRETIRRTRMAADAQALGRIVAAAGAGGIVVGLPLNMDGSEGPRCQSVRQFAANLLATISLPVAFWDERLSTVAVTRAMIGADLTRQKRAKAVDRAAAAYILQGAIDSLRGAAR
ncbi:MAG: Holliday junction resolvase RuvX [Alphaproteobacteria bacterium]|nr:Holliday junction resolvase RuvX [Alphaproteobacteria bacterium]